MNVAFAYPAHIWMPLAVLAVSAAAFCLIRLERRRSARISRFVDAPLVARLLVGYTPGLRRPLFWLTVGGLAAVALAVAQPHWGQSWREVSKQGRDILVLLDTSESMNAENPLPSRLARAKYKISAMMDRQPGDRFGLIAFSGAAVLQCPPTLDHGYFRAVLDAIDTQTLSAEGTDIAAALEAAAATFKEYSSGYADLHRDNRAIWLISDGEDLGQSVVDAAKDASEYARIYVMGVGDPNGAEVKLPQLLSGRFDRGSIPATHVSKLDEDTLIEVAKAGGGRYVRSEADDWDLERLTEFMADVEARGVSSDVRMRLLNRYQWPLALAIALFAGEGAWWAVMPIVRKWRGRRSVSAHREEAGAHG